MKKLGCMNYDVKTISYDVRLVTERPIWYIIPAKTTCQGRLR